MERLLSIEEAAELLGVEYRTVYKLVKEGEIPAGKIGRSFRIRPSDLEAYFESTMNGVRSPSAQSSEPHAICCITGQAIWSSLGIGGYSLDTNMPISKSAWNAGGRYATKPDQTSSLDSES